MAIGKDGEPATTADLEQQVEQIRKDISALTETITSLAAGKAEEVKAHALKAGSDVAEASSNAFEAARDQVCAAQADLEDRIRAKPLQSLGVAAGIGFFLALLTRRA
ncbi:DUF883 domain-containing protein [Rhizobiaceae bacterium BDR2-2]|uniref:DUF883 domain-containing protein n=1 Tax=Ectorhizobium quercum TaxID=2965071 RepID=A0AAE3MXN6_9HYPH|nr:DUF883 domain-containing protein [Ectorhizobium quercum]MCX8996913.1 DUF883 domain-containing protein [Ectorhizobium quercum]